MEIGLKHRLAFALDVPASQAKDQIDLVAGNVGWIKTNSVFVGGGIPVTDMITKTGTKLFLDLKWYDIPNTVVNYVSEAMNNVAGLGMFNMHASGGFEMMKQAVEKAKEMAAKLGIPRPLAIAITVLTSFKQDSFAEAGYAGFISDRALKQAELAQRADCDGVVASSQEATLIKKNLGQCFLVITPAIRFEEELKTKEGQRDQKRLGTPRGAIAAGSDILVMGSSLIKGGLPAIERAYKEIALGIKDREHPVQVA